MSALVLVVLFAFSASAFIWRDQLRDYITALRTPDIPREQGPIITTPGPVGIPQETPRPRPLEINLGVPFSSQAPHGNWELPYQETCEETSAMLVDGFWSGRDFSPDSADAELLDLVGWSQRRFGFYFHTTVEQTAVIFRKP